MRTKQIYLADVAIIGAGVIGCAVANELQRDGYKVLVIELHPKPGMATSSRNSEVIHAGIYYPQDSLKARLCVEGRQLLYEFASQWGVAHQRIGKILIATDITEEEALEDLRLKAEKNGVENLSYISKRELKKLEPEVFATKALFSADSGIVSAHEFCHILYTKAIDNGSQFIFRTAVKNLDYTSTGWVVTTDTVFDSPTQTQLESAPSKNASRSPMVGTKGETFTFKVKTVVNCAGLYADWIAALAGIDLEAAGYELHWTKGDYFALPPSWGKRLRHLIYPVPEKQARGLGVHVTLDLGGQARLGPNVINIARLEDYTVDETSRLAFFTSARHFLPALQEEDLSPAMSGIRPKLSRPGEPQRDFVISEESRLGLPGLINLIGIESPGLTSALAIGKYVRELVA